MTAENISQPLDLNEETRKIWDQNATFWDEKMGDGNDFQRLLVAPASERLLSLQPGETVLEIACFRAGMVLDGLEEPAFNHPHDGSKVGSMVVTWAYYNEIPPALVARLRIPN
jgi:hypothetical protein